MMIRGSDELHPKKEQKNESFVWCPVFYESKVLCGTIPESTTHRTTTNTNNTRRRERESLHIIVRYFPFVA